jgi:signal transduction histidine kinase
VGHLDAAFAVLEERNKLAGEIHDSLAQFFTGISLRLGARTNRTDLGTVPCGSS